MVEVVTASLEDQLVDPLSCRLTQTASYITKRISCTFRLQGSNIYRPTSGTKRIKNDIWSRLVRSINFSYNVWFLKNDSGALPLYLVGGVWGFFTRLSIWISAQVIEDIDSYNRAHEMFQVFSATDSRANDYGEVFCNYWQANSIWNHEKLIRKGITTIPASSSMTIMFRPLAGILQVRKYFPLHFMPLTIALSFVSNAINPIIYKSNSRPPMNGIADFFYNDNSSNIWSTISVHANCDLITLDKCLKKIL